MRYVSLLIVTMIILVTWLYSYSLVVPCQVPIRFSIGTIDSAFSLSPEELQAAAIEAVTIWAPLSTRSLFRYDPDATLAINLLFDERHARFQTKEMWQAELNRLERRYRALEAEYNTLEARYQERVSELAAAERSYEARLAAYQTAELSGAPIGELRRQATLVNTEQAIVNELVTSVNRTVDELNAAATAVNQAVAAYNTEAEQYNAQFGAGEAFTQGDFSRDSINIYTYRNRLELVRVLAHEFGHALGLEHVEDEAALMYYMVSTSDTPVSLTEADQVEFIRVCQTDDSLQARISRVSSPVADFINQFLY